MPKYLSLPDGTRFEVREGETVAQASRAAMAQYPELFQKQEPPPVAQPPAQEAGFDLGDTATAFKQGAVGSTKALTDVFGAGNAASNFLDRRNQELEGQYSPERKAEKLREQARMSEAEQGGIGAQIKAGVQNATDSPVQSIAQGVGSFAPYAIGSIFSVGARVATLGSTAYSALMGIAKAAPTVIATAQGMGAVKGAIYDAVLQAEIQDGANEADAKQKALAAQSYIGENLDQIALGAGIGYAQGKTGIEKVFKPGGAQGLAQAAIPRAAKMMGVEAALEGPQEGQERYAANKALQRTGRAVDSFQGVPGATAQGAAMGALAAGPVAIARGPETPPGASPQEKRAAAVAAAKKQEEEAAAHKQTPEYAQEIMQRYDALTARKKELDAAANATVGKDDLAGQQAKGDARKARQELMTDPETHETVRAFNENKARIAELRKTPEEHMLEQTGVTGAGTDTGIQARGKAKGLYRDETSAPPPVNENQRWVAQRVEWALGQPDMRAMDQGGSQDLANLILEDPKQAAQYVATKPNIPGLRAKEQTALIKKVGTGLAALDTQAREAGRAGTAAAQLRQQSVEMEEQAFMDEQRAADEEQRKASEQNAASTKNLTKEMLALRGMADKPGPYVPTEGVFAPGQAELAKPQSPAIGQAAQSLSGETQGLDLQFNKDRNAALGPDAVGKDVPTETGPAKRVQGGFRLFNDQGAPDKDTGFRPLQQRVARLLASPDLTDEAYQFLRTVEDTMPQLDSEVEEARQGTVSARPNAPAKNVERAKMAEQFEEVLLREASQQKTLADLIQKKRDLKKDSLETRGKLQGVLQSKAAGLEAKDEAQAQLEQLAAQERAIQNELDAAWAERDAAKKNPNRERLQQAYEADRADEASRAGTQEKTDTATLGSLYSELDTALAGIERGEQGVTTEGVPRYKETPYRPNDYAGASATPINPAYKTDLAALEAGQTPKRANNPGQPEDGTRTGLPASAVLTPTSKRTEATTPRTLRGPSSGVRPGDLDNNVPQQRGGKKLEIPRMLSERLSLYEQARAENEGQRSLFEGVKESIDPFDGRTRPNVDKGAGDIKDSPEEFARFMNSPFVRTLRKKLREARAVVKKGPAISALKKNVDALAAKVERMQEAADSYRQADQILRQAKVLAGAQLDAKRMSERLTELVIDRMQPDMSASEYEAALAEDEKVLAKASDMARGNPAYKTLVEELAETRDQLGRLRTERILVNAAINTLDAQIKVAQASNTIAQKREASPFPYELTAAEEALRGAQASLAIAQSENTAQALQAASEAGKKKRAAEAVDESTRTRLQDKRRKAENKRIEALHGENKEGVDRRRVFALSDVQQEAKQRMESGEEPTLTLSERTAVAGDPQQVLGGYRARARALEKQMQKKQQNSRSYAGQNVEKLRATQDRLFEQYKAAKSAEQRDVLGAKFDEASAALRAAEQRFKGEDVMWPGADQDIKSLREAFLKVEWLEDAISRGDFELAAPSALTRREPNAKEQAQSKAEQNSKEKRDGRSRSDAPSTSGASLLKSQIKKLQKPQKTQYQGKGTKADQALFESARQRANTLDPKSVERGSDFLERETTALSEGTVDAANDGRIFDVLDSIEENGSTPFVKEVAKLLRPLLLRTKLRVHEALTDSTGERVEALYDTGRNTIAVDSEALSEEVVIHEMGHAATLRALDAPESELTASQLAARKRLEALYKEAQSSGELTGEYAMANLAEMVSELLSSAGVRAKIDAIKPGLLRQIYDAALRMLGFSTKKASDAAFEDIQELFQPATAYTRVARADVASVLRGIFPDANISAAPGTPDAIATAVNSVVGRGEQSWWQKVMANATGLGFRTQFIDAYAPAEALTRSGVEKGNLQSLQAFQTMYFLRFGQQRNQFLSQAASTGVPQLKNQGDGTYTYESDDGPNLSSIARILSDAGIGDPQQVEGEFTAYLAIRRAGQIPNGYAKLNLKDPMSEAQAKAFMAAIKADPKRSEAYESAAQEYKQYNSKLLDFLVQTGAMEPSKATTLKRGDFVPFYRQTPDGVFQLVVMGETPVRIGDIRSQPYLQELMGDDEKILPVFAGAMQNTAMLLDMGLRNQAVKSMAYTMRDMEAGIIGKGQGPQGARAKRDTIGFKDKGLDFFVKIDSDAHGVPAELLIKGLEGIKTTLPAIVKSMAGFSNLLRAGVTRMPAYAFRQLIRDPINGWLVTGGNFTPVLSSMGEMAKMQSGRSPTEDVLQRSGAVSSNVFTGDRADWIRIMRDVSGNKRGLLGLKDQALSKLDAFATQGDTATRAVLYNMYRDKGMSHMEALMGSLESMNFSRRGASPTMHFMSMMIPFFNAQIQGVDVIYRAARGHALFESEMDVQRKLLVRGAMMTAATLAYAAAMQDDEGYKNASDEERANNYFVNIPGTEESIRLPIPFELGYAFKAIPELIFNVARKDETTADAVKTLGKLVQNTIPFGMPQALKPGVEVATNYSFYGGQAILGNRERALDPAQQYRENTTELAKLLGRAGDVSPVMIDHLVRGYTGGMGLLLAQMVNPVLRPLNPSDVPDKASKRLSELPLIGALFQPADGRGIVNEAYAMAQEFDRKSRTFKELAASGKRTEAMAYAQRYANEIANASMSGSFRQQMGEFSKYRRYVQSSQSMTPDQKRSALDALRQAELALARRLKAVGKREAPAPLDE
jgi:hypothetical protein